MIGLIAGESVARWTSDSAAAAAAHGASGRPGIAAPARRALSIAAFTIGGNLPDLDLLASYRGLARGKLEYMLQHRGYTHTILGCLVLGLLLYAVLELVARARRLPLSGRDHRLLLFAALAGTLLHLFMDYLNSYGVHPFWPLDNRWYYGDSVFIVEPLYWIAAAPLLFVQRTGLARAFVAMVVGLAIVLSILRRDLVPVPFIGAEIALAAGLFAAGRRLAAPAAVFASLAATLIVTAVFIACGGAATAASRRLAQAAIFPAEASGGARDQPRLADHVLTPMPANPLCWDLILIHEQGTRMRLRHGVLAIAPTLMPASGCPARLGGDGTTAPLVPVQQTSRNSVRWLGELEIPAGAFAALAQRSCAANALMQFARAPFLARLDGFAVIGDLRFDREPGLGFSEIAVREVSSTDHAPIASPADDSRDASIACPPTPPWIPPRAELLKPVSSRYSSPR